MTLVLVSAAVLVDADGRVLVAQRPEGKAMAGLWEFPGGKVEANETPEAALMRELREELGIELCAQCFAPLGFVSHAYETFHLLMLVYIAERWEGIPRAISHQALAWKRPAELRLLPMPPADVPLIHVIEEAVASRKGGR
jgi:8-oxo-dGTP diphosphatase